MHNISAAASGAADPTKVEGRRVGAAFLDALFESLVLVAGAAAFGLGPGESATVLGAGAAAFSAVDAVALIGGIVAMLLYVAVTRVVLQGTQGYTPGKLMMGIRCVNVLGRPPGMGKAVIRTVCNNLLSALAGGLGQIVLLILVLTTRGHRSAGDFAAKTFVVDSVYAGRMVILGDKRAHAGPESMTREDAARLGYAVPYAAPGGGRPSSARSRSAPAITFDAPVEAGSGVSPDVAPPAPDGVRATPSWDASIATWVVFDGPTGRWLRYRRDGSWTEMA